MKKEEIHLSDVARILFGEAPVEFLVEIFIRTALIYLVLMVVVRLMGKRMSGQLSTAEMAVMLTMGAIVSPGMQIPNVGLVQVIFILILAFLFQRGYNLLEIKSKKFEKLNHGEVVMLVKDSEILLDEMRKAKLSRQQLFAALRNESIFNLGGVDRVYLEAFGSFSIYKAKKSKPGLTLYPPSDKEILSIVKESEENLMVCASCGHIGQKEEYEKECSICFSTDWLTATES